MWAWALRAALTLVLALAVVDLVSDARTLFGLLVCPLTTQFPTANART